jgi:hypothetical protein
VARTVTKHEEEEAKIKQVHEECEKIGTTNDGDNSDATVCDEELDSEESADSDMSDKEEADWDEVQEQSVMVDLDLVDNDDEEDEDYLWYTSDTVDAKITLPPYEQTITIANTLILLRVPRF